MTARGKCYNNRSSNPRPGQAATKEVEKRAAQATNADKYPALYKNDQRNTPADGGENDNLRKVLKMKSYNNIRIKKDVSVKKRNA